MQYDANPPASIFTSPDLPYRSLPRAKRRKNFSRTTVSSHQNPDQPLGGIGGGTISASFPHGTNAATVLVHCAYLRPGALYSARPSCPSRSPRKYRNSNFSDRHRHSTPGLYLPSLAPTSCLLRADTIGRMILIANNRRTFDQILLGRQPRSKGLLPSFSSSTFYDTPIRYR